MTVLWQISCSHQWPAHSVLLESVYFNLKWVLNELTEIFISGWMRLMTWILAAKFKYLHGPGKYWSDEWTFLNKVTLRTVDQTWLFKFDCQVINWAQTMRPLYKPSPRRVKSKWDNGKVKQFNSPNNPQRALFSTNRLEWSGLLASELDDSLEADVIGMEEWYGAGWRGQMSI